MKKRPLIVRDTIDYKFTGAVLGRSKASGGYMNVSDFASVLHLRAPSDPGLA